MKILHLLSQIELTGAEVYAINLAEKQIEDGDQVFIMSDNFHVSTRAQCITLPLHVRTFSQRLKNIKAVRAFIKLHAIDIVHTHSRAGTWVANFAVKWLKTTLITTIHGYQKPSWLKQHFNVYGKNIIAVCGNVKQQIIKELCIPPDHIKVIPNGINFKMPLTIKKTGALVLTVAGRTTGPKGRMLEQLFETIFPQLLLKDNNLCLNILGGDFLNLSLSGQLAFTKLKDVYLERVMWYGRVDSLQPYLAESDCVIGAGRIAIESLALGVPTVALGEISCEGLVGEENFNQCVLSNFGDMSSSSQKSILNISVVEQAILAGLALKINTKELTRKVHDFYSMDKVYQEIKNYYLSARMWAVHPKNIPILMYHKVLLAPEKTRHKIYITQATFFKQMRFLSRFNFQPITFRDYFAYREGKLSLKDFPKKPIIITFDDGYVNNYEYALPVLQKFNFKAVIFVLGASEMKHNTWDADQGEPVHDLMSKEQLMGLHNLGMEIASHGLTHTNLTTLETTNIEYEMAGCKKSLEDFLNEPQTSFAYPYGKYNDSVKSIAQSIGFKCAVATDTGGLKIEDDLFAIFRVSIMPSNTMFDFWKKTSFWYRAYYFKKRGH